MKKKKIIGITGGIGSGKSVVMSLLEEKCNACVLLTDLIAHDLMKVGEVNYNSILENFGTEILDDNKEIDRKKLGAIVFQDAEKLALLSSITHPNVVAETKKRANEALMDDAYQMVCIESALLFDTDLPAFCDETWYIYANQEVRIERLMAGRGYTREHCLSVIGKQKSEEIYKAQADVVVDNSGTIEETWQEISKKKV